MAERVKINNKIYEYEIDRENNNLFIKFEGKLYSFEIFKKGDCLFVKDGDRFINVFYYIAKDTTSLWVDDEFYNITEVDEDLYVEEEKSEKDIKSPMPGIIKEVLVKVGQHVKKGETVVILESMKMSNELKASQDGIVKEVNISKGDQVDAFITLVRIDDV